MSGVKIKSNAICKIGQLKQVHSLFLISFLFFPSDVITNGIHSTWLCRHIPSCPRPTHHLFLCSQKRLLNLHKHSLALVNLHNQMNPSLHLLFCLHIQHTTRCLFEWRRLIGSPAGASLVRQWALSNKGRLDAVRPLASAGPPSGGQAASLTLVLHWTSLSSLNYNQAYMPGHRFGSKSS